MENVSLIVDPVLATRKNCTAQQKWRARSGDRAAVEIYSTMVLSHIFEDGNRRTAVAATLTSWYGAAISGLAIHELGLGDLREPGQIGLARHTQPDGKIRCARQKLVMQQLCQFTRFMHFGDDVASANKLTVDENLRNCGPL